MKSTAKLLCLVLALCVALTFGACNKSTGMESTTQLPADGASIYYLSGAKYAEVVYDPSQLEIGDASEYYIYFLPEGTGELVMGGISYNSFTYADGVLTEEITGATCAYSILGDTLSLEQDGVTLVFTRGELPDWLQPQEEAVTEEVPDEVPEEIVDAPAAEEAAPAN